MARPSTTTVRDLRKNNRSRALWQVFLNGPLTRQEVGTVAGLSPATVSNLVAALVAEGVVASRTPTAAARAGCSRSTRATAP
jgi:DNA-binding transcriptional regulator LsrR (DeoR family)